MQRKLTIILLVLIVLIGSYLRLDGIFKNLFAFTYDVGRDLLAVSNILQTHKISLIGPTTGLPGIFYGPWWYLIILPFFLISFGNPQGIELIIALLGIATIFLGFLLGKKIEGNFLGFSLASLIAVSPALVSLSSQIWSPNISPSFLVLILLILNRIYTQKVTQARDYFILGLLAALISDLGCVFGLILIVGLTLAVLIIKNKKLQLQSVISYLVGGLVIFSPRIIFEFRHKFLMTNALVKFLTTGAPSQVSNPVANLVNRLGMMFNQFNNTIALDNRFLGGAIILFIVITILILYKKTSQINKQFIKTSLIILLTFIIILTFFKHDVWPHYLIGLPVIYILLLTLAISMLYERTKNYLIPGIIVLIIFLINLNPISIINNFTKPVWVGDASVYKNQLQAIDYVYREARGKPFKYIVYTPPIYDYTYQYLFKWYGPNKYHYPPSQNSNLAFFILEPDLQYPIRLTNWLETREKDGQIINAQKFASGIIVQTRINQ